MQLYSVVYVVCVKCDCVHCIKATVLYVHALCVHSQPGNLSPSDPLLVSAARQLMGVLAQLCVAQPDSLMHTEGENVLDTNK